MLVKEEDYLAHYGILRKSGRYPWGSGENPYQRSKTFLSMVKELEEQGLTPVEIARGLKAMSADGVEFTTSELRDAKSIAKNKIKHYDILEVEKLAAKGLSNTEIARAMGKNESTIRSLRKPGELDKALKLEATADMLRRQVKEKKYVDIGAASEHLVGLTETELKKGVAILKDEGYVVTRVQTPQLGTRPGQHTTILVLAPKTSSYRDVKNHIDEVRPLTEITEDGGRTFYGIKPPLPLDSKRVAINYGKDGGGRADGMIYVRPGVPDVSLGEKKYAQVRVLVDGTHYLKGMAVYKDDLPKGIDVVFNTPKEDTGNKLDAMKAISDDPDNPFGAQISRQIGERDEQGNISKLTSTMNLVNQEGDWDDWSRKLATQVLSKQSATFAQQQLDKTYNRYRQELEEAKSLTNPAVRRTMLLSLADAADSSAQHLEAARIPRTSWHTILAFDSLKDNEVYAPNFNDGERVVLIRYPHAGTFEIPELVVNNKKKEPKSIIGDARDAIGINANVAERLSGADFDGDTVLVIPNDSGRIKSTPALPELKTFQPRVEYRGYEGMPKMTDEQKGFHMGVVSNLITDMTIKGAGPDEIVKAVKHSMVVIDAQNHNLDYKKSAQDHGIPKLIKKYRSKEAGGKTLISAAGGEVRVPARKMNYSIDPRTGKKIWIETGESWVNSKGETVYKMQKSTAIAETDNARTLISKPGTKIEAVYADHSNRLKALANEARKEFVLTKNIPYSRSAHKHYASEVQSLTAKVKLAERSRPLERQAQVLANAVVKQKRLANPNLTDGSPALKKIESQALAEMRRRTGAAKARIIIEDKEWEAIQAGAISNNMLEKVVRHADREKLRDRATPKEQPTMSPAKIARAKAMLANDFTIAEVAEALGISPSTLRASIPTS